MPAIRRRVDLAFEDAYIYIMGHVEYHAQRKDSFQSADRSRCIGKCHLNDGTTIRFRPVEPTDVSAYGSMLSLCSPKSLYSRYERLIKATPLEMAEELCGQASYCNLTLVAEIIGDGAQSRIIGAAQLLANQEHEAAEYAVLVCDPWQGKGLGGAFTSFCLKIARARGIGRVIVEFLPDNMRMIRILETREFDFQRDPQEYIVSGQKVIDERGHNGPGSTGGES